jgi:16S rRNA G966 N2-methylase RsmD
MPDVRGDAESLPLTAGAFDLVLADPPYSQEDANTYGTPMVDRRGRLESNEEARQTRQENTRKKAARPSRVGMDTHSSTADHHRGGMACSA